MWLRDVASRLGTPRGHAVVIAGTSSALGAAALLHHRRQQSSTTHRRPRSSSTGVGSTVPCAAGRIESSAATGAQAASRLSAAELRRIVHETAAAIHETAAATAAQTASGFSTRQAIRSTDELRRIVHETAAATAAQTASGFSAGQAFRSTDELRRIVHETLVSRSRRLWAGGVAVAAVLGITMFIYRKETKQAVATELSDVASRSLGDEKVQAQAQMATIQTLKGLFEHKETVQRSADFLASVAQHEQTREALVELLVQALKTRAVVDEALALTLWVLNNDAARENLVGALVSALCSDRFQDAASDFVVRFFAREEVQDAVATLLKDASLNVLQEPNLQAKTSEHLWMAVKGLVYTPRPPKQQQQQQQRASSGAGNGASTLRRAQSATDPIPAAEAEAQLAQQIVGQQSSLRNTPSGNTPAAAALEPLLRRASNENTARFARGETPDERGTPTAATGVGTPPVPTTAYAITESATAAAAADAADPKVGKVGAAAAAAAATGLDPADLTASVTGAPSASAPFTFDTTSSIGGPLAGTSSQPTS